MRSLLILSLLLILISYSCSKEPQNSSPILGFELLTELNGHWIGSNQTPFGDFDWFTFDFRPISSSHTHSIYEGATKSNIINSVFVADFEGKQQIMARNGGWLNSIYRATYFVLDQARINNNSSYYRLVDAVGGAKRAYIEFEFKNDKLFFKAYKDNSGSLDEPVIHMSFEGTNENPSFAQNAIDLFNFPQEVSEVNLNDKFIDLVDPDSALFLDESLDPFPKSDHGYVSDLEIILTRGLNASNKRMLFFISTEPLISPDGNVNIHNINTKVIRTIDIFPTEETYLTTYLHPDNYYLTVFVDNDENAIPSSGDIANISQSITIQPETKIQSEIIIDYTIP